MRQILIPFLFIIALSANAQLDAGQKASINELFEPWKAANHPGGVVGVMQKGKVVYMRAFGLASLDYKVPNSYKTVFNIASISKQFTAMGIIKLEEQGLLSFDDEIQKYLPTIPQFEHKITIRNLMHHTSGLRSLHGMLQMAGWRDNDPRSTEDLFRFMEKQKELNFEPGSEFLYCNTGYNFMARIIENVTGEDFISWTKENIFKPLEMNETYIEENYSEVVPRNATSYNKTENGFERSVPFWGYMGSGNAHTNVSDLLKWYNNFNDPAEGWDASFNTLQTKDTLNSGELNNYAFGVMLDDHNGISRIQHSGGIGGYRSFACAFPDQDINIVLLTNFSSADVRLKIASVSDLVLDFNEESNDQPKETKAFKIKSKKLKKYENNFWNSEKKFARKLYVKNDTLWYFRDEGNESALLPIGKDQFKMMSSNVPIVQFDLSDPESIKMIVGFGKPGAGHFESFNPIKITDEVVSEYTGSFYSTELDTKYTIRQDGLKMIANQKRLGDLDMELLNTNVVSAEWPLGTLVYRRDNTGQIIGFHASNGRVRNMWFEKMGD